MFSVYAPRWVNLYAPIPSSAGDSVRSSIRDGVLVQSDLKEPLEGSLRLRNLRQLGAGIFEMA